MSSSPETRSRTRVRLSAGLRHPVAWIHSHATGRRGVERAQPPPEGANEVLERLATLPISTWTYGFDHESVRHLGPMAQDFASTFGLGYTDRQISIVDANGVCMAAVQALHRRVVALEAELARVRELERMRELEQVRDR